MTRKASLKASARRDSGVQVIRSIEIENFRCFQRLSLHDCRLINVIVGDSGSGKTALLEALFMALGHSPQVALRIKHNRGLEGGGFQGQPRQISTALWGDMFHGMDETQPISIMLRGDGIEARSVMIRRGEGDMFSSIGVASGEGISSRQVIPITFVWRDSEGREYSTTPRVGSDGLEFPVSGDFPVKDFFFIPSNQNLSSLENASRFSALSRARKADRFIEIFTKQYDWIEDIGIEVVAGIPMLHASVKGVHEKLPVNLVSGAVNRMLGIVLALSAEENSVYLIDEIENGVYYERHGAFWASIVDLAREQNNQVFVTTHSKEWLEAIANSSGDLDDIALWRVERSDKGPIIHQFTGDRLAAAIEYGSEVR